MKSCQRPPRVGAPVRDCRSIHMAPFGSVSTREYRRPFPRRGGWFDVFRIPTPNSRVQAIATDARGRIWYVGLQWQAWRDLLMWCGAVPRHSFRPSWARPEARVARGGADSSLILWALRPRRTRREGSLPSRRERGGVPAWALERRIQFDPWTSFVQKLKRWEWNAIESGTSRSSRHRRRGAPSRSALCRSVSGSRWGLTNLYLKRLAKKA